MAPVKVPAPHHAKCSDPSCLCHRITTQYDFDNPPKPQEQTSFIPPSRRSNLFYKILRAVLPSLIALQAFFNIRQVCIDEIKKVISCGDPEKGGSFLACPCCGTSKFVPFIVYTKASSSGMWLQRGLGKFGKKQAKQAKKIIDYMHNNSIIIVANYPKAHIDFLEGKK